ncbi:efflux transporter outer membrane subunit [soil metagenome]
MLLTAGCTLTSASPQTNLPVPRAYPAATGLPAGPTAARIGWREFFADPELTALIDRALVNNSDLHAAVARIEQAHAALRIRGADLAPQVSGSLGTAKIALPDDLAALLRDNTLTSYNGLLQTSWEIDLFGKLRSLRAAALEQYLASAEAERGLATSLIAQVASAYLADRAYAERLDLARDTLANRERSLNLFKRRYQIGSGSKVEVTQGETLRTQAAGEIQAIEMARAQNLNALALLVGEPVDSAQLTHRLAQVGLDQPIPAGLPSELLANRPDITAAEHQLRGAEANIGAARAAFFPSISLTAAAGSASNDLDGLFANGTGFWLFRPSISLPIFTGGKLHANLRGSEARSDEMLAAYEKSIQSAFRDVADALAQRRWLAEQLTTADQSIAALTERARLSQLRYDAGRAAYLEVLDAERDRFSAEQKRVQLRRAWLASGVALYAALGGGFPESDSQGRNP